MVVAFVSNNSKSTALCMIANIIILELGTFVVYVCAHVCKYCFNLCVNQRVYVGARAHMRFQRKHVA